MFEEEESTYVCIRVVDLARPHPASRKGRCDDCGVDIWMMPHAPPPERMPRVCLQCAQERMDDSDDDHVVILPGSLA